MYRGNHPAKVEPGGRLKLPVPFKDSAAAENVTEFFITSTNGKSAELWPLAEWEKREQVLARHSTLNPAVRKFKNMTSYYGQQVKMDGQGRVTLPQILREAAKLDGEVLVFGQTTYLEVFDEAAFKQSLATNEMTEEECNAVAAMLEKES
jgi:MraZ protein